MTVHSRSKHRQRHNKRRDESAYAGSYKKASHPEAARPSRQPIVSISSRPALEQAEPPIHIDQHDRSSAQPLAIEQLDKRFTDGIQAPHVPRGLEKFMQGCEFGDDNVCGLHDSDFDDSVEMNDFQLNYICKNTNLVVNNTMLATLQNQDKNSWVQKVFVPLLHLVFAMYNKYNWSLLPLEDIIPLNPDYGTFLAPELQRDISDSTGDFTLGYCPKNPALGNAFDTLQTAGLGNFSDNDNYKVLYSGFEVAAKQSDINDAELQLSLWAAASLRRKRHLLDLAQQTPGDAQILLEPMVIMVGARHYLYYCYSEEIRQSESSRTFLLQSELFEELNTWTVCGVFRVAKVYGTILQYGVDKGSLGFGGQFIDKLVASIGPVEG